MSREGREYVWTHSPYRNAERLVHLVFGDIANKKNGYRVWMKQANIAKRAAVNRSTVNRWIAKAITDGYLELVEDRHADGLANIYLFLMPNVDLDANGNKGTDSPNKGVARPVTRVRAAAPTRTEDNRSTNHKQTDAEFEQFWSAFPNRKGRKVNKGLCLKLWANVATDERPDVIVAAKHYAKEAEEPAIMNPSTFFVEDKWRDYVEPRKVSRNGSSSDDAMKNRNPRMNHMGVVRPEWRHECRKCNGTGEIAGGDCDCAPRDEWLAENPQWAKDAGPLNQAI